MARANTALAPLGRPRCPKPAVDGNVADHQGVPMAESRGVSRTSFPLTAADALVVVPDQPTRLQLTDALTLLGYTVTARANVDDARTAWDQSPFSLVVIDWTLPGHLAQALCRVVQSDPRGDSTATLLVLAAPESDQEVGQMLDAGATDILPRPWSPQELRIRLALAERRTGRRLSAAPSVTPRLATGELRQKQERDLLNRVLSTLASELELAALFRTVVEEIASEFGYTQVSLYLLEDETLVLQHQVGYDRVLARIPIAQGISGQVARTGLPMLIPDVRHDPRFLGAIDGIVSEVCVPFHDNGRIAGIINVESTDGVVLGDADLQLLTALSQHVSIGVGRARIHDRAVASEARLQLALDAAGMGAWDWHIPSGQVAWSRQLGPLYGLPEGTPGLPSAEWFDHIHPDDRASIQLADRRHIRTGADYQVEFRVIRPNGTTGWLIGWGRAVERDPDGRVIRTVGLTMDVSARKEAERKRLALIRESMARADAETAQRRSAFLADASAVLAGSLDLAPTLAVLANLLVPDLADWCAIDLIDDDGTIHHAASAHADPTRANRITELRQRFPIDRHAIGGAGRVVHTGQAELHPEFSDAWLQIIAQNHDHLDALRGLQPGSAMVVPLVARGAVIGVITIVAERPGRYGPADLHLAEDIGRRAALAVDNARLFEAAQAGLRSRDHFLSVAAHELRTPLTTIAGFAELLLRDQRNQAWDHARAARFLARIAEASTRLGDLVNDLLDVSRIGLGGVPLRPCPIDLTELLMEIGARYRDQFGDRHPLTLNLPASRLIVECDPDRIEQVIANVITNAAKYSPAGGTIRLTLDSRDDGVSVAVADDGIGFPPGAAEVIFEPFARAPNAEGGTIPGLGLGLAISRNVMERHGGRIWAESAGEGRGTTVHLWLPNRAQLPSDEMPPPVTPRAP